MKWYFSAERRSRWSVSIIMAWSLLLGIFFFNLPICRAATPSQPNIIFILADDLGYGDLGCYGQQQIQTPNLDRMAKEGMRFTRFYAGSTVCAPSRCTLMTGLHTGHCLIRGNRRVDLRDDDYTVAEMLQGAGYRTGMFGKWGLGSEGGTGLPTRQGFDEFFGYLDQSHAHNYYPTFLIRGSEREPLDNVVPNPGRQGQGVASEKKTYSHDLIIREALDFVDRNRDKPFFLYLPVTIPHANNEAGDAGMEVPSLGIYADRDWPEPEKGRAAMITYLDRDIGRLMKKLKDLGIDRRTIVFFSSDNGPHNEGGSESAFFNSSGSLRGSKRYLYEGGIRVPLIVRWPGKVAEGTESDHVGAFWDFMPTAAALAHTKAPPGIDGISFAPTLLGKGKQKEHDYLYWEFHEYGKIQALLIENHKALRGLGKEVLLYDLAADPAETNDIAAARPDLVKRVENIFDRERTPSEIWPLRYQDGSR
ncbi:MAG: arylsulfatase [Planctomycetota bacterium]|nr:arylsulfatase [Planctomycetota bacterium]